MLSPTLEDAARQDIDSNAVNANTGNVFNDYVVNENGLNNYLTQSIRQYQNIRYTSNDMTNQYNTPLAPEAEAQYQEWKKTLPRDQQSEYNYDLRGYFKEMNEAFRSGNEEWANQFLDQKGGAHLTDTYKKPNHHTFSNYSIYAKNSVSDRANDNTRSEYYGGTWDQVDNDHWVYTPTLQNFWDNEELKDYFNRNEIGNILNDTRQEDVNIYQGIREEYNRIKANSVNDVVNDNLNNFGDNYINDTVGNNDELYNNARNAYTQSMYDELKPQDIEEGGLARYGK